jgi:hypothetical protein
MSLIEIQEEIASDVDINLEVNEVGIYLSVYVDDCEIQESVDWREFGLDIVEDVDTYSDAQVKAIAKKMQIVSQYLLDALRNGRE